MPLPQLKQLDVGKSFLRAYQLKNMQEQGMLRRLQAGKLVSEMGYLGKKHGREEEEYQAEKSKEIHEFMESASVALDKAPEDRKEDVYNNIIGLGVSRFDMSDEDIQKAGIPKSYANGGKEWFNAVLQIHRAKQDPQSMVGKLLADYERTNDPSVLKAIQKEIKGEPTQAEELDLFKKKETAKKESDRRIGISGQCQTVLLEGG